MHFVWWLLLTAAQIWVLCAIARAVLSWFPLGYDSPASRVNGVLVAVTEPLIAPVRRMISPVRVGSVGIDFSFLIVVLLVQLVVIPFLFRLSR